MPRKKVRFCAKVDGQDREIFAVGEGADGDLAIIRRAENGTFSLAGDIEKIIDVLEHRVSIHVSRESATNATTIVHTTVTGEGDKESGAALVKYSRYDLLWPIYSALCPDLRNIRYSTSKGKTSKRVRLVQDVPVDSALMYHVFAIGPDTEPPEIFQCAHHIERFKDVGIVVYTNYINLPAMDFGVHSALHTTDIRMNGEIQKSNNDFSTIFPEGAVSFTGEDVDKFIADTSHQLAFNFFNLMIKMPGIGEENRSFLKAHPMWFTRCPLVATEPTLLITQQPARWIPPKQ